MWWIVQCYFDTLVVSLSLIYSSLPHNLHEFIQHFCIWQSKYLLSAFLYPLLAKNGALRPYFNLHKVCKFNTFENVSYSSSFSVYDITSLNLYRHTLTLSSHKNTNSPSQQNPDMTYYTAHESQQFKRIKAEYRDYVMRKKFSNLRNWNAQWLVCLLFQNFLKFILYNVANKSKIHSNNSAGKGLEQKKNASKQIPLTVRCYCALNNFIK